MLDPVLDPILDPVLDPALEPVVDQVIEPLLDPLLDPVLDPALELLLDPALESQGGSRVRKYVGGCGRSRGHPSTRWTDQLVRFAGGDWKSIAMDMKQFFFR